MSKDYEVGYRRPPKHGQFKPGQSGNPRGRPKGASGIGLLLEAALSKKITVNENGKRRRISKLDAAIQQVVNKAAAGNEKAVKMIMEMISYGERVSHASTGEVSAGAQKERDEAVLNLLKTQMQSLVSEEDDDA